MTDSAGLLTLLHTRRSVRRYTKQPVPPAVLEALLTAASMAPSAHNRQPWRLVVIDQTKSRQALAQSMGARLRADRLADGDDPQAIEADVARAYTRITQAPVAILLALDLSEMDHYGDQRDEFEQQMAVQSVAMAGQNLLLAAHAHGLGACWLCAPLFCSELVIKSLNLPSHWQAQGLITIGYPSAPARERGRKPINEVVLWR